MNKGKGIQMWVYPTAFLPVKSTERTGTSLKASVACLGLISSFLYLSFREEIYGPQQSSFIQAKKMLAYDRVAWQQNRETQFLFLSSEVTCNHWKQFALINWHEYLQANELITFGFFYLGSVAPKETSYQNYILCYTPLDTIVQLQDLAREQKTFLLPVSINISEVYFKEVLLDCLLKVCAWSLLFRLMMLIPTATIISPLPTNQPSPSRH